MPTRYCGLGGSGAVMSSRWSSASMTARSIHPGHEEGTGGLSALTLKSCRWVALLLSHCDGGDGGCGAISSEKGSRRSSPFAHLQRTTSLDVLTSA
ncbi:hypothetical protein OH77DRAFT_1314086 [Trametes cingulata]|nr:hypothetical protein OH77DRAFT_1314086 [Trametes cingulata]